jgi:hypothetical protein
MTFHATFPPDCSLLVASFLGLPDCVMLSLVSTAMMKEILPVLNSRRNQINDRYGCIENRLEILPGTFMVSKRVCNINNMKNKHLESNLAWLPTFPEQVSELSHLIPQKHMLYESITEMLEELNDVLTSQQVNHVPPDFSKINLIMQKITRPIKLYKQVISKVICSSPIIARSGFTSVSLDQYIGDVLCITYLCYQSNETLGQIVETTLRRCNRLSTYLSWVLLHCAILRRKKFSKLQLKRLGIPDFDRFCSRETTLFPLESVINSRFMSSEMTLAISTLGPRGGSSFRLRDNVEFYGISAHCLYAYFNCIDVDEDLGYSQGAAGQIATEWLCRVHEEVAPRRLRPVVVEPPTLRLNCSLEVIF